MIRNSDPHPVSDSAGEQQIAEIILEVGRKNTSGDWKRLPVWIRHRLRHLPSDVPRIS
jgi:hypothetical protein